MPRVLSTAALTVGAGHDYYHLLSVGADVEEDPDGQPGVLYLASGEADQRLFGGVELPACQPVKSCALLAGDFNQDGVEELWVGRTNDARDASNSVAAQVLRLTAE